MHRVYRSAWHSGDWPCKGFRKDVLGFRVSKPVTLQGVQHFGSKGGEYTVSVELKDTINSFCLVKQTGTYFSVKDETYRFNGFDVMFDHPVFLERVKRMILYLSSRAHHLCMGLMGKNLSRLLESSFHLAVQVLLVMELK